MPAKFIVFKDKAYKFRFNLEAANGKIIYTSKSYPDKKSVLKGIASIVKNAPVAKIDDITMVEIKPRKKKNSLDRGVSTSGIVFGNVSNANTIYNQQTDTGKNRFTTNPRHSGYAAEQANHLYDTVTGHKTEFAGDIIDEKPELE